MQILSDSLWFTYTYINNQFDIAQTILYCHTLILSKWRDGVRLLNTVHHQSEWPSGLRRQAWLWLCLVLVVVYGHISSVNVISYCRNVGSVDPKPANTSWCLPLRNRHVIISVTVCPIRNSDLGIRPLLGWRGRWNSSRRQQMMTSSDTVDYFVKRRTAGRRCKRWIFSSDKQILVSKCKTFSSPIFVVDILDCSHCRTIKIMHLIFHGKIQH